MIKDLAIELEAAADKISMLVSDEKKEKVHVFQRKMAESFSSNVMHAKENTFKNSKDLRENKNITFLAGDKGFINSDFR